MYIAVKNATEAWEAAYKELIHIADNSTKLDGVYASGAVVAEILNAHIQIANPRDGIVLSPLRNMPIKYALGELLWYLSGSNMLNDITPYSKFWANISDDGDTVNSAYGHRIQNFYGFDQWEFIKRELRRDPLSRRAVIHIKDASDAPTKDTPCTCTLQYFIRDRKLFATTYMRSNDIWLGLPFDVFAFTALQVKLAMELGVDVGTYTHIAGSLHLYEKDVVKSGTSENTCKSSQG